MDRPAVNGMVAETENNIRIQRPKATKETKRILVEKQVQCDIDGTPEDKVKAGPFSRKARFRCPIGRRGHVPPMSTPKVNHDVKETETPTSTTTELFTDKGKPGEEVAEGGGGPSDQKPHIINFPQNFECAETEIGTLCPSEPSLRRANSFVGCQLRYRTADRTGTGISRHDHNDQQQQQQRQQLWLQDGVTRRGSSGVGTADGSSRGLDGLDHREIGLSARERQEALRRAVQERRSYHICSSAVVTERRLGRGGTVTGGGGRKAIVPEFGIDSAARSTGEQYDGSASSGRLIGRHSGASLTAPSSECGRTPAEALTSRLTASDCHGSGADTDPVSPGATGERHDPDGIRDLDSQLAAAAPVVAHHSAGRTQVTASGPTVGDRMPATPSGYPDAYLSDSLRDRSPERGFARSFSLVLHPARATAGQTKAFNSAYKPTTNGSTAPYHVPSSTSTLLREVEQLIGEFPGSKATAATDSAGQGDGNQPLKEELTKDMMDPLSAGDNTSRQSLTARRKKVDTADPGVSNTTQLLIQQQLRKSTFQFPEVSVLEKRRALGTPREDAGVPLTQRYLRTNSNEFQQRPPRTSRTSRQSRRELVRYSSIESGVDLDLSSSKDSEHFKSRYLLDQSPSRIPDSPNQNGIQVPGPKTSNAAAGGGPNRGRYSKLVSLGLPNVKLDLEHNHFSRGSIRRRSQRLRQNVDATPESTVGESSRAESVKSGSTLTPKDLIIINTGLETIEQKPEQGKPDDDPDQAWPGLKLDLNYVTEAAAAASAGGGSNHLMLSQSMDALRGTTTAEKNALAVPPSPRRSRSGGGGGATPRAEATISYSFYQLQPPPGPSNAGQGIEVVKTGNSLTPKYRYVHNTKT